MTEPSGVAAPLKRFTVVSLFPELICAFRATGVVRRGCERGLVAIECVNPRDFAGDRRGTVDAAPYGGGPGMVMMVAPLRQAIAEARRRDRRAAHVLHLTPQGRRFEQADARELARFDHLVLVAGRYEGIDERVVDLEVDSEWSIGDFVVSGGELPAMLLIDAVFRTLPGALGDARSAHADSFAESLLDHPHYTRPDEVDGSGVPAVLLSGDHAAIARWRRKQQLGRTWTRRPDLLSRSVLGPADRALLEEFISESRARG